MSRTPERIETIPFEEVETFPEFTKIQHGQLFSLRLSNNTTAFTHALHRFPAKYIPQVPAWALDTFGSPGIVTLDPFMGSGTTLVEGVLRGGTHIGLDIDPLARFIARAKVDAAHHERIAELAEEIKLRWREPARQLRPPMPDIYNFDHWFNPRQWAWLQSLKEVILALDCSDEARTFLLAVFSSTLRRVSNADDQSQKTYVSGTHHKAPPAVPDVFWRFLGRAIEGLADLNRKRHSEAVTRIIEAADATNPGLPPHGVSLAITSPPYLDSVDYPYNLMLEYFWLGPHLGIPDRRHFNALRGRPVGAKHPVCREALPECLVGLIRLDMMAPARQAAASTYFSLMARHFRAVALCLVPGARYVLVVGNSQSRLDVVPVHQALVALAASAGLRLERAFGYRIRRHYMKFPRNGRGGIILIDWVLVLRKQRSDDPRPSLPLPWVTLSPRAVAH